MKYPGEYHNRHIPTRSRRRARERLHQTISDFCLLATSWAALAQQAPPQCQVHLNLLSVLPLWTAVRWALRQQLLDLAQWLEDAWPNRIFVQAPVPVDDPRPISNTFASAIFSSGRVTLHLLKKLQKLNVSALKAGRIWTPMPSA